MSLVIKLRYILKLLSAAAWVVVLPVTYAYTWENPTGLARTIKSWLGDGQNQPSLYVLAVVIYLAPNLLSATLFLFPVIRRPLERSNLKVVTFIMWWSQPRLFVGRGMHEGAFSLFNVLVLLLATKLVVSFYVEIKPLVQPTKDIMKEPIRTFKWHEFFPHANNNIGVVVALWAPIILPILVFMSKVDGKFQFSPISVNFLPEVMKVIFAIVMLIIQSRKQKVGEKPLLARSTFIQAARNNVLLAVPALLYAINNYLKFIMQLYFNPATLKMLSNLKVLVIAVLLKFIMRRRFSVIQWEALALLLIGISVNQLRTVPAGNTAFGLPVTAIAYIYTLIFVTVPSLASVYNEYALKSQYDTSIYLQNLFLYGYGAIFNFLGILGTALFQGPESFNILRGHSRATMFLICNNAAQGILSSLFFKYADTILKKYSSTVATIFTVLASAAFLGHTLTINFLLGISVVFVSMHQFFSPLAKVKDDKPADLIELEDTQNHRSSESSFVNMTAGAADDASHRIGTDERQTMLPT